MTKSLKLANGLNGGPTLADNDAFGNAVALLGDIDGDGVNEFAVGANNDDTGGINRGAFYIFSFKHLDGTVYLLRLGQRNLPSNTFIGNITSTLDAPNTFTYTLVSGVGSINNSSFTLSSAGALRTASSLNYESGATRSIRVRTTRQDGLFFENAFTVVVNDVNERPTANAGSSYSIGEGFPLTLNGTGTDPDANTTLSYEWDFNYDGTTFDVDSTSQSPSSIFPDGPASRTVGLRVVDNGLPPLTSVVSTATVTVMNLPPSVTRNNAIVGGAVLSTLQNSGTWADVAADNRDAQCFAGIDRKKQRRHLVLGFCSDDEADQSLVTITASDEDGGSSQATFNINAMLP